MAFHLGEPSSFFIYVQKFLNLHASLHRSDTVIPVRRRPQPLYITTPMFMFSPRVVGKQKQTREPAPVLSILGDIHDKKEGPCRIR